MKIDNGTPDFYRAPALSAERRLVQGSERPRIQEKQLEIVKKPMEQKETTDPVVLRRPVKGGQDDTFLEFSLHKETGTIMVKVMNRETQEVVREIPSEKILDLVAALWEMNGILVDEKV